jgi:hypothetical protein
MSAKLTCFKQGFKTGHETHEKGPTHTNAMKNRLETIVFFSKSGSPKHPEVPEVPVWQLVAVWSSLFRGG